VQKFLEGDVLMRFLTLAAALLVGLGAHTAARAQTAPAQPKLDPANTLVLELKSGKVTIELRPDLAPKHVERVKQLAKEGFYNGIKFHRVIAGFMAQSGDPTGTGRGGSKYGNLPAEFTPTPFNRGVIGAARTSDPNSANSQFFIMLAANPGLNGQYTVWGRVVDGMMAVDAIKKGEPPADPDVIVKAYLASDAKK
jgi:peptidylprolyl isomerase